MSKKPNRSKNSWFRREYGAIWDDENQLKKTFRLNGKTYDDGDVTYKYDPTATRLVINRWIFTDVYYFYTEQTAQPQNIVNEKRLDTVEPRMLHLFIEKNILKQTLEGGFNLVKFIKNNKIVVAIVIGFLIAGIMGASGII